MGRRFVFCDRLLMGTGLGLSILTRQCGQGPISWCIGEGQGVDHPLNIHIETLVWTSRHEARENEEDELESTAMLWA